MREHEHPQPRRMALQPDQAGRPDHRDCVAAAQWRIRRPAQADHACRRQETLERRGRRPGHDPVMSPMRFRLLIITLLATAAATASVFTQTSPVVRGINGSWEAYPLRGEGFGSGIAPKTPVTAAAPVPEPPLK